MPFNPYSSGGPVGFDEALSPALSTEYAKIFEVQQNLAKIAEVAGNMNAVQLAGTNVAEILAAAESVAQNANILAALADRTEAAVVAAEALGNGFYDTTAAGLAATADGGAFAVLENDLIKIYRRVGVAAVYQLALPSNESILALGNLYEDTSGPGTAALADSNGTPVLYVDEFGDLTLADGSKPLVALAAAITAGPVIGFAEAETNAAKLLAEKLHYGVQRARKFDVMVWQGLDPSRNSNGVRMSAAPDFLGQTTTLFAHERSGLAGAEDGLGVACRNLTLDFINQSVTLGAITTISRGSVWLTGIGQNTNPMPFRIQQGVNAGIIEVLHSELTPDNVTYTTSGTQFDFYRRTSADNYASKVKVWDGLAVYTTLGLAPPTEMIGFNPAPGDNLVEIPAGYPNAGRRIVAGPMPYNGGQALVTYYSEKDSTTWQVGEWFDFQSLALGIGNSAWNEVSLIWTPEGIHAYVRNDALDGVNAPTYYNLTHRGRFYAFSATGIGGWTNKQFLTEPNIGNTPNQALRLPDGSGKVFIGGSTQLSAGNRRQYKLFMGYSPTEFIAACKPHYDADLAGYGTAKWVLGNDGQMWIVLLQEHGDGFLGFNGTTNIYATCMNMAWVMQNMETI